MEKAARIWVKVGGSPGDGGPAWRLSSPRSLESTFASPSHPFFRPHVRGHKQLSTTQIKGLYGENKHEPMPGSRLNE